MNRLPQPPPRAKLFQFDWREMFNENTSYKLVALCVTLILWVTILGRRDFSVAREMEIEYLLPGHLIMTHEVPRRLQVTVAGPRMAIKKFQSRNAPLVVDLSHAVVGRSIVRLGEEQLDLPFGAKVMKIDPEEFYVTLRQAQPGERHDGR